MGVFPMPVENTTDKSFIFINSYPEKEVEQQQQVFQTDGTTGGIFPGLRLHPGITSADRQHYAVGKRKCCDVTKGTNMRSAM